MTTAKPDCGKCVHAVTPSGRQCYTMSRRLDEMINDKGHPFSPEFVIPVLDEIAATCDRYKE